MKKTSTHETSRNKKPKRPRRLPPVSQPVVHQRAEVQLQATALDEVAELGNGILAEAGVLLSVEYDIYIYIDLYDGYMMVIIWL